MSDEVWEDLAALRRRVKALETLLVQSSDTEMELRTRMERLEAWKYRVEKREQEEAEGEDFGEQHLDNR
jgi:hypothetical protein